jgi:hypothetical protein
MGNTQDGFHKKRDYNQYGEVEKEKDERDKDEKTDSPNKFPDTKKK